MDIPGELALVPPRTACQRSVSLLLTVPELSGFLGAQVCSQGRPVLHFTFLWGPSFGRLSETLFRNGL